FDLFLRVLMPRTPTPTLSPYTTLFRSVVLIGQALGIACRCRRSILVVERLQLQCDGTAIDFDSVSIEVVDRNFEPDLHVFTVSGAATTEWPGVPDDNGVAVTGPLTTARGHRQSKCADCRRGQQLATAISRDRVHLFSFEKLLERDRSALFPRCRR